MATMETERRRSGRPREPRIDRTVTRAARALLAEVGYEGLTVDAVAARAKVGKAGIYRRFGSKAEMVFSATVHHLDIGAPADTGTLAGDLLAVARLIQRSLVAPGAAQVIPALVAEFGRDPALAKRFRDTFFARERAAFATIAARAVDRGELARAVDEGLLHLLVIGPLFTSLFALQTPLSDAALRSLTTVVARGLAP